MKILIPSEGTDLKSEIGNRFGTSPWFLICDPEAMITETLANPGASGKKGAGMQAVVLAIEKKVDAVLTGYCSPTVEKYLRASGIEVFQGLSGTGADILRRYKKGNLLSRESDTGIPGHNPPLLVLLVQTLRQFAVMLPLTGGVIGLLGLFNVFVTKAFLLSIFSGNKGLDTLKGACMGSISAGNPINSYIIGDTLLKRGVSLFGITAFIIAWVSVGLIQLPAEISVLGGRFALYRNLFSFLMAVSVAFLTVMVLQLILGGIF